MHKRDSSGGRAFTWACLVALTWVWTQGCGVDHPDTESEAVAHTAQALGGGSGADCTEREHAAHRYLFCDDRREWQDARLECEARGMHLARIDDEAENDFIHAHVATDTWIGGNDIEAEGVWRWTDGEQFWSGDDDGGPVGGLYTNWSYGKPRDLEDDNCVQVRFDGRWQDDECDDDEQYICEGADHCEDGTQSGDETDVDCGGSCPACAPGLSCQMDGDCSSGECSAGVCASPPPSCDDGIENGAETDVDCGGPSCGDCGVGAGCVDALDCATGRCRTGQCVTVACGNIDGLMNGQAVPLAEACPTRLGLSRTTVSRADPGAANWSTDLGQAIRSAPAVGPDGTIYVGNDSNRLHAVAPTGAVRWSFLAGGDVRSSPAIDRRGTVIFGSDDERVYAVDAAGQLSWSFVTGGDVRSSPVIGPDGVVYIGSNDDHLYAISPEGALLWRTSLGGRDVRSSPALSHDARTIYVGSDADRLYAVDARAGTIRWAYQVGDAVRSAPTVAPDGSVLFGSDDGDIYALRDDGDSATLMWKQATGDDVSGGVAVGPTGIVYATSQDGLLRALRPDAGLTPTQRQLWSMPVGATSSSPVVGSDGLIVVASDSGMLRAIDPSGTTVWSHATGSSVHASPVIAPGGYVLLGDGLGRLSSVGAPFLSFTGFQGPSAVEPAVGDATFRFDFEVEDGALASCSGDCSLGIIVDGTLFQSAVGAHVRTLQTVELSLSAGSNQVSMVWDGQLPPPGGPARRGAYELGVAGWLVAQTPDELRTLAYFRPGFDMMPVPDFPDYPVPWFYFEPLPAYPLPPVIPLPGPTSDAVVVSETRALCPLVHNTDLGYPFVDHTRVLPILTIPFGDSGGNITVPGSSPRPFSFEPTLNHFVGSGLQDNDYNDVVGEWPFFGSSTIASGSPSYVGCGAQSFVLWGQDSANRLPGVHVELDGAVQPMPPFRVPGPSVAFGGKVIGVMPRHDDHATTCFVDADCQGPPGSGTELDTCNNPFGVGGGCLIGACDPDALTGPEHCIAAGGRSRLAVATDFQAAPRNYVEADTSVATQEVLDVVGAGSYSNVALLEDPDDEDLLWIYGTRHQTGFAGTQRADVHLMAVRYDASSDLIVRDGYFRGCSDGSGGRSADACERGSARADALGATSIADQIPLFNDDVTIFWHRSIFHVDGLGSGNQGIYVMLYGGRLQALPAAVWGVPLEHLTSMDHGIFMRTAPHPWGPWSNPELIYNPNGLTVDGYCEIEYMDEISPGYFSCTTDEQCAGHDFAGMQSRCQPPADGQGLGTCVDTTAGALGPSAFGFSNQESYCAQRARAKGEFFTSIFEVRNGFLGGMTNQGPYDYGAEYGSAFLPGSISVDGPNVTFQWLMSTGAPYRVMAMETTVVDPAEDAAQNPRITLGPLIFAGERLLEARCLELPRAPGCAPDVVLQPFP